MRFAAAQASKCGGNYAAATRAGEKAAKKGYSQVVWVDGVERKYVEEGGGMNLMFVWDGKLVTPELNGSILPGVTRKSILELARSWGMETVERKITVDELMEGCKNGTVQEAFMVRYCRSCNTHRRLCTRRGKGCCKP